MTKVHARALGIPGEWDRIKRTLVHLMMENVIPPMIDSGNYHVCKFDMVSRETGWDEMEYGIVGKLSIAETQKIYMADLPKLQPQVVEYQGQKYERVCLYCGNALRLDERGGCVACGAGNGGYK